MKKIISETTSFPLGKSIFQRIISSVKNIRYDHILVIMVGLILAILLRYSLIQHKSVDYIGYFKGWYDEIKLHGFHAFKSNFYDYYPPYLYLVYLLIRFFPNAPAIIITKTPSMASDFVCALFAYLIVRLKFPKGPIPFWGAFVILFAPTIVINSAFWGQTDSLFTAAILAGLYFFMIDKKIWALFAIGVAFSFKAQTIFIAPFLLGLFLRKELNWKHLLLIPLVMALALIPAWMAGRPLLDLLQIYPAQAGEFEQLTLNAPTLYALLPDSPQIYRIVFPLSLALTGILGLIFSLFIYKSRSELTPSLLLELSLVSFMMIPFFLPKMHERYFYPADVISIIFAFYLPRYFFIPIVMSAISFFAYLPFLFGQEPVPMPILAVAMFVLICIVMRHTILSLDFSETSPDKTE